MLTALLATTFLATITHAGIDDALAAAEALTVTVSEPSAEYDRSAQFADGWKDTDKNGCDTRNDVLARDLSDVVLVSGSDCKVQSGTLEDPYTGTTIRFTKDSPTQVQIDHIVPLSWAWQNGADSWTQDERVAFANNTDNLLAVQGKANMSKGDKGPSDWMPANPDFSCEYAVNFTTIVATHDLTIPPEDKDALVSTLHGCAGMATSSTPSASQTTHGADTSTTDGKVQASGDALDTITRTARENSVSIIALTIAFLIYFGLVEGRKRR